MGPEISLGFGHWSLGFGFLSLLGTQEVAAENGLYEDDDGEGHGQHEEAQDGDGSELPLLLEVEDHHRHDLGVGREENDRGRQLPDNADEDEAPGGDDPSQTQP